MSRRALPDVNLTVLEVEQLKALRSELQLEARLIGDKMRTGRRAMTRIEALDFTALRELLGEISDLLVAARRANRTRDPKRAKVVAGTGGTTRS
jgi:predicted membrane chloride channel (bestrophin family)